MFFGDAPRRHFPRTASLSYLSSPFHLTASFRLKSPNFLFSSSCNRGRQNILRILPRLALSKVIQIKLQNFSEKRLKFEKKRSPIDAAARTIERRRRAKRSSTGASPPFDDFVAPTVDVEPRNRLPLPPAERALPAAQLVRRTTFELCREYAGHSSNAEKAKRSSLFFPRVGYNKRYLQLFQVFRPVIFRRRRRLAPNSGRFWKKVRQNR